MNIFNNFIPTRILKFYYKKPVRMSNKIISNLKKRSKLAKKHYNNPTSHNKDMLVNTVTECPRLIIEAKEKNVTRLSAQLEDSNAAPKTYWSILNRFLHNKKIANIPPILVNGEVVSNFSEKVELFNSHFTSQCTPIVNNGKLPSLEFKNNKRLGKNLKADKAYR